MMPSARAINQLQKQTSASKKTKNDYGGTGGDYALLAGEGQSPASGDVLQKRKLMEMGATKRKRLLEDEESLEQLAICLIVHPE